MRSLHWHFSSLVVASFIATAACTPAAPQPTSIRIGWQVPWATEGQIAQALKHTNALALNGLHGDFKGFSYGGPLNEATMAGDTDVIFTADQPAATLLANGARWKIIARLMFNRVALYVPPDSAIKTVADLRGKTVAMPFGAAAQRDALKAVQSAGLNPASDIKAVNLDILEQTNVVQAGDRTSWNQIDAMAGFDPTPAQFERAGVARMLHVGSVVSLVLMSEDFLQKQPQAATGFMKAFLGAYAYYAAHREQADQWFLEEARLTFDPSVLELAASVEPNVWVKQPEDLDVWLRDDHVKLLQEAADFIFEQGLVKKRVDMASAIDQSVLQRSLDELKGQRDYYPRIQPTSSS